MEELFARDGFAHRFEILAALGAGATVVYAANDRNRNCKVVLKFLDLPANAELRAELLNNLRASMRLTSKFVVRTYEVISANSCACLVLEWIDGKTLSELMTPQRALPFEEAHTILRSITRGLNDIHLNGLFHRDLKLDNVMVCDDGAVKIVDLGLLTARELSEQHADNATWIHSAQWITGTPVNLAPEYFKLGIFDERTELYALGCLAYELVTGFEPFVETNFQHLVTTKLSENPIIALKKRCDDCPDALANWILKLLESDPQNRFSSAAAALDALTKDGPCLSADIKRTRQNPRPIRSTLERLVAFCDNYSSARLLVTRGEELLALSDQRLLKLAKITGFFCALIFAGCLLIVGLLKSGVTWPSAERVSDSGLSLRSGPQEITSSQEVIPLLPFTALASSCEITPLPDAWKFTELLAKLVIKSATGELCTIAEKPLKAEASANASVRYAVSPARWPRRNICKVSSVGALDDCVLSGEEEFASPVAAYPSGIFFMIRAPVEPGLQLALGAPRLAEVWYFGPGGRKQISALYRPITLLAAPSSAAVAAFVSPGVSDGEKSILFVSTAAGEEVSLAEIAKPPSEIYFSE